MLNLERNPWLPTAPTIQADFEAKTLMRGLDMTNQVTTDPPYYLVSWISQCTTLWHSMHFVDHPSSILLAGVSCSTICSLFGYNFGSELLHRYYMHKFKVVLSLSNRLSDKQKILSKIYPHTEMDKPLSFSNWSTQLLRRRKNSIHLHSTASMILWFSMLPAEWAGFKENHILLFQPIHIFIRGKEKMKPGMSFVQQMSLCDPTYFQEMALKVDSEFSTSQSRN